MFSLSLLFLTLPLYFSHIFLHFGVTIGDGTSFERQKMLYFGILLIIATGEMLLMRSDIVWRSLKKYGLVLIGLLAWPLVPTLLYGTPIDTYWIRGSYEKFHGYFLYSGIIWLAWLLTLTTFQEKKRLLTLNLIVATVISMIAMLEYNALPLFLEPRVDAWGEGIRAIATLGNPNYLAGYLLISLPWIQTIKEPYRTIVGLIIIGGIFSTKSYIGMTLVMLFVLLLGARLLKNHLKKNIRTGIILGILVAFVVGLTGILTSIDREKLLSLESRGILVEAVAGELGEHPIGIITGYGPESVLRFFESSRSQAVSAYFSDTNLIDSSHNIIVDYIFQYGLVPIVFFGYWLLKRRKSWDPPARDAWFLGMIFLLLNPYVIVHLSLLILTALTHDDNSK